VAVLAFEHFSTLDRYGSKLPSLPDFTCVRIWLRSRPGVVLSYSLAQLCPDPARSSGVDPWYLPPPCGESWRTWYDGAACDGGAFSVRTTDLYEYRFSLRDGRVVGRRLVWVNASPFPVPSGENTDQTAWSR
jgi:hypothetical protein